MNYELISIYCSSSERLLYDSEALLGATSVWRSRHLEKGSKLLKLQFFKFEFFLLTVQVSTFVFKKVIYQYLKLALSLTN